MHFTFWLPCVLLVAVLVLELIWLDRACLRRRHHEHLIPHTPRRARG